MLTVGDASPLLFWKTRKRPKPIKSIILKSSNTVGNEDKINFVKIGC